MKDPGELKYMHRDTWYAYRKVKATSSLSVKSRGIDCHPENICLVVCEPHTVI